MASRGDGPNAPAAEDGHGIAGSGFRHRAATARRAPAMNGRAQKNRASLPGFG